MDFDIIYSYESFKKAAIESNTLSKIQLDKLNSVQMVFVKDKQLPSDFAGLCLPEKNVVLLKKSYFYYADYLFRQKLIDHELGHCVLNRVHHNESSTVLGIEFQKSIMNFMVIPYESLADIKNQRAELFNKQYYGTLNQLEKITSQRGGLVDINELRILETNVMNTRIKNYQQNQK
jgi:hypothetical protein